MKHLKKFNEEANPNVNVDPSMRSFRQSEFDRKYPDFDSMKERLDNMTGGKLDDTISFLSKAILELEKKLK